MQSITIGRRFDEIALHESEYDKYIEFIAENMKDTLGDKVSFSMRSVYSGLPALILKVTIDGKGIDILVVSDTRPWYRLSIEEGISMRTVNEIVRLLEWITIVYYETKGKGVVYYAFVPKMDIAPPKYETATHKFFEKLFLGNMVVFFALSLIIFYALWIIFRYWTPYVLLLSQIPILILAPKIIERSFGDWILSRDNRYVYLVGIRVPLNIYPKLLKEFFYPYRFEFKKRIYLERVSKGEDVDKEYVKTLLNEYGIEIPDEDIVIRRFDIFNIVERVFSKFRLPIPKIIIANMVLPNAAATGALSRYSGLLITTGLLTQLSEEEIEAVLAHEASHLRNHDTVIFYILASIEYLLRIFIFYKLWYIFILFPLLEFFYLFLSLTVLFFLGKFVETRADSEAALRLDRAGELANALRKIGLRKLIRERSIHGRLNAWLRWDVHPPLSFRIERLERIAKDVHMRTRIMRSLWLSSIIDCITDFKNTLLRTL
ncbi:MAG: hypothetical protein DRN53_03335 [Thermoprotei archaeon]|nr:MAG: hypothetical protein DRN53_03335 [Thermoprotei archaeon]